MTDHAPAPNDAFSSLFDVAGWLYPRVWASYAAVWAMTLLPGDLLSIGFAWALGLSSPADVAAAAQAGEGAKILLVSFGKVAIFLPAVLIHGWATMLVSDAAYHGVEKTPGEALGQVLTRLFALLWTLGGMMIRILPLTLAAGVVGGLTVRDSPLTAAACALLAGIPLIYFTTRWMFSSAVTLFEGVSGGAALRRSSDLVGQRFWRNALQFLVYNVLVMTPAFILGFVVAKVVPAWSARVIATGVSSLTIAPFSMGLFMALYWRESARGAAAPV